MCVGACVHARVCVLTIFVYKTTVEHYDAKFAFYGAIVLLGTVLVAVAVTVR